MGNPPASESAFQSVLYYSLFYWEGSVTLTI